MDRAARWVTGLTAVYVVVVLAVAMVPQRALGHDEAIYAVGARGLWSGDAADDYPSYRPAGMRLLAAPGVVASDDERVIRLPFALIALGYLAVVYALARRWFGAPAAALAVAVQATMTPWQWRAVEALSDIPSAMLLLGVVGLCADGARAWRRAVAAGVLAALACWVRYGSMPAVAVIFAVALVSEPARWRWLALAAATYAVGIAPFFVWSAVETGSVTGILETGERMGVRRYLGAGIVYYVTGWPYKLAGPVGAAVATIGVVLGLAGWRRDPTPAERVRRLLVTAGLLQMLVLGWRVHGEARFVFFATTCFVIAGASWLAEHARRWKVAVAVVAAFAIPSAIVTWVWIDRLAARRVPFTEAAAAIRADTAGQPCLAFSTEVPMVVWYAGCRAIQVDGWGLDPARATGAPKIYLLEAKGLPRSIGGVEAATRAALGWHPVACAEPGRWCVWRATGMTASDE